MIDFYDWAGGREAMLRFGPETGPVVVAAMPLFEEANRARAVMVAMLRALARLGVASVLPDLPGQGESPIRTEQARFGYWCDAFEAAVDTVSRTRSVATVAAFRGGALLDGSALVPARWYFAPMTGETVVRDLWRIRQVALGLPLGRYDARRFIGSAEEPIEVAGNALAPDLLADLLPATPFASGSGLPVRIVRLESDPRPADHRVPGMAPWRRSEPTSDQDLAETLAADLATWVATCGD